jgi:hypothetical protein
LRCRGTNKDHGITLLQQTEPIIPNSDAAVFATAPELPDVTHPVESLSPFDQLNHLTDSAAQLFVSDAL